MITREMIAERMKTIEGAIRAAGREASTVTIVAVTKTVPVEVIAAAHAAGLGHFGENRLQEAAAKIPLLPREITWHFVGHLQTNKAGDVVDRFSWIHSLDSSRVIAAVSRRADAAGRELQCLLQVNLSGEGTKAGCRPEEVGRLAEEMVAAAGIVPAGLMTVPPPAEDPEASRPWFRELARIGRQLQERFGPGTFPYLSMGMSDDYRVALEEGATHLRIGRGLFGPRDYGKEVSNP